MGKLKPQFKMWQDFKYSIEIEQASREIGKAPLCNRSTTIFYNVILFNADLETSPDNVNNTQSYETEDRQRQVLQPRRVSRHSNATQMLTAVSLLFVQRTKLLKDPTVPALGALDTEGGS
jgi:hypothetical protein